LFGSSLVAVLPHRPGLPQVCPTVLPDAHVIVPRTRDGHPPGEGTGVSSLGRIPPTTAEFDDVDLAAGVVGLVLGALVAPLADRIATNSALHDPLLRRVPRSPRLPLVLLGTALLGGACGLVFGFTLEAAAATLFCWILVVVTRTDLEHRLIPDKVVLPGAVAVLALRTIDDPSVEWILSALAVSLALFLVVLAYPRGLGMGDVKLSGLLGAGLGISVIVAMFVGFFVAFVPAAVLFARHGRAARKSAIPLGPFLALGGVIALFWGGAILDWYRDLGMR
jgi:prepilin signal peptidase PulO-like enzyme (type II secretory pathway)